jgi:hypothetical protein
MKKDLLIIFGTLLLTNVFGITKLPNTPLLILVLVMGILGYIENRNSIFIKPIAVFIVGLLISIISCKVFREQDYLDSFKALPNYFFILFYFGLIYLKPKLTDIENAFIFLTLMFNTIYILQFVLLQWGVVFVSSAEGSLDAATEARFRMAGSGLSSLGLFFGLNKFILKKKLIYLIILISSLVVILLMSFRTMIFFSSLFAFILIFKINGFNKKTILWFVVSSLFFIVMLNIPVLNEKVQYMINKQQTETLSNKDYVRVVTMDFYLRDYFKSPWEMLFGSGQPFSKTAYYKYHESLNAQGIYYVDWGLWGLSWVLGILSVCGILWYSIKAFLLKVPMLYYYLGIWFLYLVVSSITTAEFFRAGNFVIQALCLYALNLIYVLVKIQLLENEQEYIQQEKI